MLLLCMLKLGLKLIVHKSKEEIVDGTASKWNARISAGDIALEGHTYIYVQDY